MVQFLVTMYSNPNPFMSPTFTWDMRNLDVGEIAFYSGALLFLPTGLPAVAIWSLYIRYGKKVKRIRMNTPTACAVMYVYFWPITIPLSVLVMPFCYIQSVRADRRARRTTSSQNLREHLMKLRREWADERIKRDYAIKRALRNYDRDPAYDIVLPSLENLLVGSKF